MSYFSNAARDLKRALSDFLEKHIFKGLSIPQRKFVADACYGLLKSGSPLVSELRLYRAKRWIQAILSHTQGRPEIRKRSRRPKPNQLTLF